MKKIPMKKLPKKLRIALLVMIPVCAAAIVCFFVYQNHFSGAVSVYQVSDGISMSAEDMYSYQYDGMIQTDGMQVVTLSESQTVDSVAVKQGQTVKKGDKLFSYDSTLTNIDLQRAYINIQKVQLELKTAQNNLKIVQGYRPGVPVKQDISSVNTIDLETADESTKSDTKAHVPEDADEEETVEVSPVSGDGTRGNPYVYDWQSDYTFTPEFILAVMQGKQEAYVTFRISGDALELKDDSDDTPDTPDTPDTNDNTEPETPDTDDSTDADGTGDQTDADDTENTDDTTDSDVTETAATRDAQVVLLKNQKSGNASADKSYSASWTIQFQRSGSAVRWQLLSISLGGVEQTLAQPMGAWNRTDDTEEPNNTDPTDDTPTEPETPDTPDNGGDDGDDGESGTTYTANEIQQMRKEQQNNVRDLKLQLRQAQLEYTKLQYESKNDTVYSELDGVVTYVGDPKDKNNVFIKVGDSGGYVVQISVNEFTLKEITVGQPVSVTDWMSGESYDGTVKSIGEFPSGDTSYEGNMNSSYYPVQIHMDDIGNLSEDNGVGVTLLSAGDSDTVYLESSFVVTENGKHYVYVRGDDGKLEKRQVQMDGVVWSYYAKITSGLTMDDWVAFPYGRSVKDGAATEESTSDQLYNS